MALELASIKRTDVAGFEGLTIIDCDTHNEPGTRLLEYLPEKWRQYMELVGLRSIPTEAAVRTPVRPMSNRLDSFPPSGGPPGSDPDFTREQLLDEYGISAALINNISLGGGNIPYDLELAMVRAINDYNEEWIEADPRWLISISTSIIDTEWNVREILRCREKSDRYVQIWMDPHRERPAGNPANWPIYELAAELDIPVNFHVSGRPKHRIMSGVGPTTYYTETRTVLDTLAQPVVASLIFEGVLDRWPNLKVGLIEMDWTWVVPMAWRLDASWRVLRDEVPDLQRKPSEYLRDNFWFSTQPGVETERPHQVYEVFEQFERNGFGDKLMFASDYPHWDMDSPFDATPRRLPREVKKRILSQNAAALYGLELPAEIEAEDDGE
jgi:predicted TIM-barrel fold metal-dependent hydrolase